MRKQYVRCGGKIRYPTHNEASKGMKNLMRAKDETHLHVYRCPDCQKFHVGHKSERLRDFVTVKGEKHV